MMVLLVCSLSSMGNDDHATRYRFRHEHNTREMLYAETRLLLVRIWMLIESSCWSPRKRLWNKLNPFFSSFVCN